MMCKPPISTADIKVLIENAEDLVTLPEKLGEDIFPPETNPRKVIVQKHIVSEDAIIELTVGSN